MEQWKCDADYHAIISGRNKVRHVFQQLMDVMKEERKEIGGGVSIRLNRRNERMVNSRREIPQWE